ncbi:MAG: hypothetical protein IT385_07545 [Deltaproteobacteria bacterium]|nr:hypothetical protein [Deltaproteobacteria bacterium]
MTNALAAPAHRGVLFGQLLRGGPGRAGPIFDRLDAAGVAQLVKCLSPQELALCAALAFGPERVARAAGLPLVTLVPLVRAAARADVDRLLSQLAPERAAELRRALVGEAEAPRGPASRANTGLGVVLRLRRLFRR